MRKYQIVRRRGKRHESFNRKELIKFLAANGYRDFRHIRYTNGKTIGDQELIGVLKETINQLVPSPPN